MNADENLLFGLLAFQNNFVDRTQLLSAFDRWVLNKNQSLADFLELPDSRRTLLSALVQEHIRRHEDDPEKSIQAVSSLHGTLLSDLSKIGDTDLQRSLAHVPKRSARDPFVTMQGDFNSTSGRFRILRPHAEGGLGRVSVASDVELKREVALKEIKEGYDRDPESRSRFLLEAEITGSLEHPGIVPVYGLGTYEDGRPYYAMRFIRGDSLQESLQRFHSQSVIDFDSTDFHKLLGRFVDVCEAISYAHSRGVLHRDLKPGNIMLGKFGETLVVDWGLAKANVDHEGRTEATLSHVIGSESSTQTMMGMAMGTPAYMSPEQAAGRLDQLGPATDIYALGATLYHLLTGRPAFSGKSLGEILQRVQNGSFDPPRAIRRNIPRPLEAICLRAMATETQNRFPSARALAEDIELWLADKPVTSISEYPSEKLLRIVKRNKSLTVSIAASVFIIALVSTISVFFVAQSRNAAVDLSVRNLQLAKEASASLENETQARIESEKQLIQAEAERLSAITREKLGEAPNLAMLLAAHAEKSLLKHNSQSLSNVAQSLVASLESATYQRIAVPDGWRPRAISYDGMVAIVSKPIAKEALEALRKNAEFQEQTIPSNFDSNEQLRSVPDPFQVYSEVGIFRWTDRAADQIDSLGFAKTFDLGMDHALIERNEDYALVSLNQSSSPMTLKKTGIERCGITKQDILLAAQSGAIRMWRAKDVLEKGWDSPVIGEIPLDRSVESIEMSDDGTILCATLVRPTPDSDNEIDENLDRASSEKENGEEDENSDGSSNASSDDPMEEAEVADPANATQFKVWRLEDGVFRELKMAEADVDGNDWGPGSFQLAENGKHLCIRGSDGIWNLFSIEQDSLTKKELPFYNSEDVLVRWNKPSGMFGNRDQRFLSFLQDGEILTMDGLNGPELWDLSSLSIKPIQLPTSSGTFFPFVWTNNSHSLCTLDESGFQIHTLKMGPSGVSVRESLRFHAPEGDRKAVAQSQGLFIDDGGNHVSLLSSNEIYRWKLAGMSDSVIRSRFSTEMTPVLVCPSGDQCIVASKEHVTLWNPVDGKSNPKVQAQFGFSHLSASKDGTHLIAIDGEKTLRRWIVESRIQELEPLEVDARTICLDPRGEHLYRLDHQSNIHVARFDLPLAETQTFSFSPKITSVAGKGAAAQREKLEGKNRMNEMAEMKVSPNRKWLLVGGATTIAAIDLVDGRQTQNALHFSGIQEATFVDEESIALSGYLMFELSTGKFVNVPSIFGKSHAPIDGTKMIASVSGAKFLLWSLATKDEKNFPILGGHRRPINAISSAPGGEFIATAASDDSIRVWTMNGDRANGQSLAFSTSGVSIEAIYFSANAKRLYAKYAQGLLSWSLNFEELCDLAKQTAGRDLTEEEVQVYIQNQPAIIVPDQQYFGGGIM